MATLEVNSAISADSGVGSAIPYVGPAQFPTVEDFSGSAHTGFMVNMVSGDIVADVPGGLFDIRSLLFDGVDDHADFGNVLAFEWTDPFSFSFWVKYTTDGFSHSIIGKWGTSPPLPGFGINEVSGRMSLDFVTSTGDTLSVIENSGDSGDGNWHHFLITYDSSGTSAGILIYRDGASSTTVAFPTGPLTTGSLITTESFLVGESTSASTWWLGNLDEIAAYNRTLTAPEAATIYNAGVPTDLTGGPANLIAYWRLGERTIVPWASELSALYAVGSSPTANSLFGPSAWMALNGYAILGATSACSPAAGVNYGVNSGISAGSACSPAAGVDYALQASPSAGSGLAGSAFEEETLVAGCMANSLCSGTVHIGISCWSQMSGTSGFVCPGFDKIHHEISSPNPPAKAIPSGVRFVPPAPNSPNYGVGGGAARRATPSVQTPIRQPTITRRRLPT